MRRALPACSGASELRPQAVAAGGVAAGLPIPLQVKSHTGRLIQVRVMPPDVHLTGVVLALVLTAGVRRPRRGSRRTGRRRLGQRSSGTLMSSGSPAGVVEFAELKEDRTRTCGPPRLPRHRHPEKRHTEGRAAAADGRPQPGLGPAQGPAAALPVEVELLLSKMGRTRNHGEFLDAMGQPGTAACAAGGRRSRQRPRGRGGASHADHSGLMFTLWWKKLSGSYFVFSSRRRG